jgi:hypothetical protein
MRIATRRPRATAKGVQAGLLAVKIAIKKTKTPKVSAITFCTKVAMFFILYNNIKFFIKNNKNRIIK